MSLESEARAQLQEAGITQWVEFTGEYRTPDGRLALGYTIPGSTTVQFNMPTVIIDGTDRCHLESWRAGALGIPGKL
jgi:hypothetical protein